MIVYSFWNPQPRNRRIGNGQAPIYLVCDDFYANLCDRSAVDKHKYSIFWELIKAYQLNNEHTFGHKLRCIAPSMASRDDLLRYHDENYVALLETVDNYPPYSLQTEEEKQSIDEYGLIDDCPIVDGLFEYCSYVTGASLQCAQLIKDGTTRVAMNFGGGRHHAFAARASGYCYVNDIVLCIDSLRTVYDKVFYLDLDIHHCDAVQEAYYHSRDVFVASIHQRETDFFPQSGNKQEYGAKNGLFHNLNVPITARFGRLRDDAFCEIVAKICHRLSYYFQPDVVVVCCGCDGLGSDPVNKWSLSIQGMCRAIQLVLTHLDRPTVVLGGGGYNPIDTAKCWTKIVSQCANINVSNDIPYHTNFSRFAPHYQLGRLSAMNGAAVATVGSDAMLMMMNESARRKQQKQMMQAMQIIYGHLNYFERMFVVHLKQHISQMNLNAIASDKKLAMESISSKKSIENVMENYDETHEREQRTDDDVEDEEEEEEQDIDLLPSDKKKENTVTADASEGENEDHDIDIDNANQLKSLPQKRSYNTMVNHCRSRRKRVRLQ